MGGYKLYLYGRQHGFWNNFASFRNKSKETLMQITDLMFHEKHGMWLSEYVDSI